jgi:hypothetical protein
MKLVVRRCWRCGKVVRARHLNEWKCSACGMERAIYGGSDHDFSSVEGVNEGKVGNGISDVWFEDDDEKDLLWKCERGLLMVFPGEKPE